ncbi:MAG: peroxiredoxin-like family protein [Woeseiaceae bacterium]|nr:peroxiredoxin-like family protein [Woeseiaceae bacterium]
MSRITDFNLGPRVSMGTALLAVMVMSLACSMSMQYGHADVPIADSAEAVQPLSRGQNAPQFTLRTVTDEAFVFNPRELERPAVLITFRGGWCPFCNLHLSELRHVVKDIDALGVDVLFLSGDRPDQLYETLSRETQEDIAGLGYTIYSDADAQAAIALGIAFRASQATIDRRRERGQDVEGSSMQRHGVLPVPSVFAISRDGVIEFAYANADYRVRLPADELLAVAEELVQ